MAIEKICVSLLYRCDWFW